jgi:hypothetical protein
MEWVRRCVVANKVLRWFALVFQLWMNSTFQERRGNFTWPGQCKCIKFLEFGRRWAGNCGRRRSCRLGIQEL